MEDNQQLPEASPLTQPTVEETAEKQPRRTRARRKPVEDTAEPTSSTQEQVEGNETGQRPQRIRLPDPHALETVSLTAEKDGPRMRLGRSASKRRMEIQFDTKPGDEVLQALKDAGFRYDGRDKVWTLPLDRGAEWRSAADAERLFKDLANTLRAGNGLAPVGMAGQAM